MVLKEETADRTKASEGEKPRAEVFFVAYTKDGAGNKVQTSDNIFVQWRTGVIIRMAASGSAGPAECGVDR